MNEPVMAIRAKAFHKQLCQSSCTCLLSFFYIVSFIYVKPHLYFWSRSYSKQLLLWPLLHKNPIPLCTFLKFHTYLEVNSARSFQNVFEKCSRVLNLIFRVAYHLNNTWPKCSSEISALQAFYEKRNFCDVPVSNNNRKMFYCPTSKGIHPLC